MIRDLQLPGVFVETVENHKIYLADQLICRAFPNGSQASIVIYGQSLGGPAAIHLCERLKARGITVRLLVVIDAVGSQRYTVNETALRWHWMGGHVRMEYDPEVWGRVRDLIAAELGHRY
jgi:thioesterase domain-containing protein